MEPPLIPFLMIPKNVIVHLVEKQLKSQDERPLGWIRHQLNTLPYLTDRALLLGGIRGSGRSTLLGQMRHNEYPQAWYMHFEDPRLAGFDAGDFAKVENLIVESGRGVVLLDKVDQTEGWIPFVCGLLERGIKVVATISLDTWLQIRRAQHIVRHGFETGEPRRRKPGRKSTGPSSGTKRGGTYNTTAAMTGRTVFRVSDSNERSLRHPVSPRSAAEAAPDAPVSAPISPATQALLACCERFLLYRVPLLSYTEFLEIHHKRPSENAVQDYLQRGAFPEAQKGLRPSVLFDLYETILDRDVLLAKGIRDQSTLRRIALRLIASSGTGITANAIRKELRIKAVTTVTEHFDHLERAGLVSFVSYWSDNPARRYVNPRKVYAVDTAMATVLTPWIQTDRAKSFETVLYHHLARRYDTLFYTSDEGGCDFIVSEEGQVTLCVQSCYETDDPDILRQKIEGLVQAVQKSGAPRGLLVTPTPIDRTIGSDFDIEITDADTFLSE